MENKHFEKFYRQNIDRIFRFVFFRVGHNRALAEDLVSDIFLKALRAFASFDESISPTAWIYRIAQNHLANYWRDRKVEEGLEEIAGLQVRADGMVDHIQMLQALAKLSQDEQTLVTMHYLEGYTYVQMAEILGRPAGTLRVAIHRAINKLKRGER